MPVAVLQFMLVLILAPFLFGVINRTKAVFAGRRGAPLLQLYYDIGKLWRKGVVYSTTTTLIFIAGPVISLGALLSAALLIPFAGHAAVFSFNGDLVLFFYLLGLARFVTVLAALDTGSSFEGMGASREVLFGLFAEPTLFLSLAALARLTGKLSLSEIFADPKVNVFATCEPVLFLVAGALFLVFLTENSRIPVDDPNTHLELTMIHEVMVLDHGGVDLGYIFYGVAIKFWLLGTLLTGMFFSDSSRGWAGDSVFFIAGMILLAIVVGIVESALARLRLIKVPHFLVAALALSILALTFAMRP